MPLILLLKPALLALVLLVSPRAAAQGFEIPPVGTDETFNVATWNIEHFGLTDQGPTNVALQFENVLSVMQQANVHLWALQEMNDSDTFFDLVEALGENWAGVWQPDQTSFSIGYGYIYRTDVVEPTLVTTILTSNAYDFAFRPPLLMRANVTIGDETLTGARFINLHMKCCGSFTDWQQRSAASEVLKAYSDNLLAANFPLIILGDFNDRIRVSNSSGRPSPFSNFRNDEDYHFGSLSLEDAGVNTYCGNASCTSGSTIDHILIGSTLIDEYEEDSTARYDALLTNIPQYVNTTSDHVAVYARFDFSKPSTTEPDAQPKAFGLSAPFPNPFRDQASVAYSLTETSTVRVEVFDALGRRVALVEDGTRTAGNHEVTFSASGLTPGMYLVRLSASGPSGEQSATRRAIRVP